MSELYTLPPQESQLTADDVRAIISEQLRNFNDPAKVGGGYLQSANFVSGVTGWQLTPSGGQINFALSVGSLNIPDQTTVNSFHVDTNGNTWWGSNVATGYTGSNAYILNTGSAVFKNVSIGGVTQQYVITNSGIFSYGDTSDGNLTITANTTLTSDKNYGNLTINNGAIVDPGGYRIFCSGTLTLSGNGAIQRNGNNGGNASGSTGGTAAAAISDGYLKGSVAGVAGANGVSPNTAGVAGTTGNSTLNSLGLNGVSGGAGGNGQNPAGGGGANGGVASANVKLTVGVQLATLLDISSTGATVKYNNSASGGSGGSGGGDTGGGNTSGGGGGSASPGAIIAIYAKSIVINAGSSITANGGTGGNGGNAVGSGGFATGGGGGGAGGNGGQIILTYNTLTNNGTISASGGTGGTGGTGLASGFSGGNGTTGSTGNIRQFQLSL